MVELREGQCNFVQGGPRIQGGYIDDEDCYSTSGGWIQLPGPSTQFPLVWLSKSKALLQDRPQRPRQWRFRTFCAKRGFLC